MRVPVRPDGDRVPALEGLRGIAVALIVLHDAQAGWVGDGALLAIEVFLVVAGYQLTSALVAERRATGRVDVGAFVRRRALVILPAIVLLFGPIGVYAMTTATAAEVPAMRADGLAALAFASNWSTVFRGDSALVRFGVPSPFLHLWPLAVAVQGALVVAMASRLGLVRWGRFRRSWGIVAGVGAVLSAGWMALLTTMGRQTAEGLLPFGVDPESLSEPVRILLNMTGGTNPTRVLLGTDTRLQGLLVGVALAAFLARSGGLRRVHQWGPRTRAVTAGLGLGAMGVLLFGVVGRGATWIYYGGFLLFDLAVALVVVAAAAPDPPPVVRWLAWRPLVSVGTLSYSLYVWHLPVFVFLDETHLQFSLGGFWLVAMKVAVAVVVAVLSFVIVERPIQRRGLPTLRWRGTAVAAAVVSLALFASLTAVGPSESPRAQDHGVGYFATVGGAPIPGLPVVAFFGDSTAYDLASGVADAGSDLTAGLQVRGAATPGCGLVSADYRLLGEPVPRHPGCAGWEDVWTGRVDQWHPDLSLLISWVWDINDRRIARPDGLVEDVRVGTPEWAALETATIQRAIDLLSAQGGKVALLTLPCIDHTADTPDHFRAEPDAARRIAIMNGLLREVVARNASPDVTLIDLAGFLCPDGEHHRVRVDGVQVTNDTVHYTPEGAVVVWRWMEADIRALLAAG